MTGAAPITPATKVTPPITMALAARTRPRAGAACGKLTWSKTAVATVRPLFCGCTHAGEVTNGPACTVGGRPARLTVPTLVQRVPSAESYPVSVSPARTSRSQRGEAVDTVP